MNSKHRLDESVIERLVEHGLPGQALDEVRSTSGFGMLGAVIAGIAFIVVMIGCMAPPVYLLTPGFAQTLHNLNLLPEDTLLVGLDFYSAILLVFGGIFLAGFLLSSLVGLIPPLDRRMAVWSMGEMVNPSQKHGWAQRAFLRRILRTATRLERQDGFLLAFSRASRRLYLWGTLPVYGIGALMFWCDYHSMTFVTPEGVSVSRYLEMERRVLPWDQAENLTIGCQSRSTNDGSEHELIYEVTFADGTSRDFGDTYQPVGLSRIEALAAMDLILREKLGTWQKAEDWTWPCFDHHRKKTSQDHLIQFNQVFRQNGS